MLMHDYQKAVDALLKKVRDTQEENMIKAGKMIADSIEQGGNIYLNGIVHGVEGDVLYRGGGPIFYKKFTYDLHVESNARKRDRSAIKNDIEGLGGYALRASSLMPGDVLFVSSVSGRTLKVVDLAVEAKKMGIKVIALSSMVYADAVEPVHSSGKKLHEIVDLVLDNCAPAAEAMMDVEGIEAPFAAASGIASDYILWNVTSVAVEELMKRGKTPGILKSANFPGGPEYNHEVVEPNYEKQGY